MDTNTPSQNHEYLEFSSESGASGSKAFQTYTLREGLALTLAKPTVHTPLKANFDIDEAPIQFGFTYSGKNRCTYSNGRLRNQTHEMQAGSNGIFYLPKTCGTLERACDNKPCAIGILVSPEFLRNHFTESMDQFPKDFQKTLEGSSKNPLTWFGACTPVKHSLLAQIINCPYTGGIRRLFLEGRALELLALQLHDYMEFDTRKNPRLPVLSPADVERIHCARDILVSDLENPPSIQALAVQVGINEKKLKTGFRQVYNTSVFGYFREHRMQKAHELLRQGNLNVTEAAFSVGYQSLSHFSQAFKERFGILPKEFLTSQRILITP
ncbi:helix-turn-helix transcriptional regulator [Pseudodesulfovibrio sediminis]|uniref:AraC family transcriptional regulator n=1 Tax=Pseudodesulfovibrio sediminis TaxID=2810563 RepID=A0ABN6EN71_9BACT|nr:AraC family transcriptional regulator [Pseudodesulfovibrio sediminis]BCS87623.1 AraC family transcriptional regulator [Pseudodesulfovibrio sediminis]